MKILYGCDTWGLSMTKSRHTRTQQATSLEAVCFGEQCLTAFLAYSISYLQHTGRDSLARRMQALASEISEYRPTVSSRCYQLSICSALTKPPTRQPHQSEEHSCAGR